jgi:DNA sulfur modification protein DndB
MTIDNVHPCDALLSEARRARQRQGFQSVRPQLVSDYLEKGWIVARKGKSLVRLAKDKAPHEMLEDRVWSVLYAMGFTYMSGRKGARLISGERRDVGDQVDVVAIDDDVALYVECKSAVARRRATSFAEHVRQLASYKPSFTGAVAAQFSSPHKRKVGALYWALNLVPTEQDLARSKEAGVRFFEERDLNYYEALVSQLGAAAKYQFLADVFPNQDIPGLHVVVPAIRSHMGGTKCYSFAIAAASLLKVAYVSHRMKGAPDDIDTYQRLVKRSRLRSLRAYIERGGIFPTNIVVSLSSRRRIRFDKAEVPRGHQNLQGDFGYLYIPPAYKSAWIIDGQHRLFAYAGEGQLSDSPVSVLAFEGLSPSQQANMFVDINAEQRSVKRNLLVELWAELHWESKEPAEQAKAVVSKAVVALDGDPGSPLMGRVLKADEVMTALRCITMQTLTGALNRPEFFVGFQRGVMVPGAFWRSDLNLTMKRAMKVINAWLAAIYAQAEEFWDAGKGDGGGIAMNDGVAIILAVLRSVIRHLSDTGREPAGMPDSDLCTAVKPFASILGSHFASLTPPERSAFRRLRGIQGQTTGTRQCQVVITKRIPDFAPAGLQDFMVLQDAKTSEEASAIIFRVQRKLSQFVIDELKTEYGPDEQGWWGRGVPKAIRIKIDTSRNEEPTIVPRESKFMLIDYRDVAVANWPLFGPVLGMKPSKGAASKEKQTAWVVTLNEIRNVAAHPERGFVTMEQLDFVRKVERWLSDKLVGKDVVFDENPSETAVVATSR